MNITVTVAEGSLFISPEEVPPCPICREVIGIDELFVITRVHDIICVCHLDCIDIQFFNA
jgi:hypothetical protein